MKRIALLLTLLIVLSSTDACSQQPGQTGPDTQGISDAVASVIPDEQVTLTLYSQLANFNGEQGGWAAEILREKFNVKFTIINEIDGTFATRMAAGDLGDIILFGNDGTEYLDAVEAGMLFDWEEDDLLNDYGPYIASHMPNALDKNRNLSGGNLYGFGHNVAVSADDHEAYFYYPYLRYDLYKAAGSPAINTLEDFVPALKAMQALEPVSDAGTTTYGVSLFPDWDGAMVMVVKSTAALYGWDEFGFGLYDVENQVYEDALKEDGWYLRCLKFYNMLYQEGLLDPDSMTQTFDDMNEKYTNGSAIFNIFSWMASPFNTPEHMNAGKAMQAVAAKDQKNLVYGLNAFGGNRIWAIGSKSNYPELCMAIIDWFSTPEGALTSWYGPKGVTWDYDADGDTYLTELGLQAQQDKENTQITYGGNTGSYRDGEFQHNNTTWSVDTVNVDSASGETFNYIFWESTLENKPITAIEQEWRDDMGYLDTDAYLEGNGYQAVALASDFSMAARDAALETTWTQVQTAIRSGSWSAIYAESDAAYDEIVAKMIADAKAYGYDECVAWTQEQANLRKEAEDRSR